VAKPDAAQILASMVVTGQEKLTFRLRLLSECPGELDRVLQGVADGDTYIVARTNTVVNSRRPDPFEPAAVIMPWGVYEAMCAELEGLRGERDDDGWQEARRG
jgi:hypothetical protein